MGKNGGSFIKGVRSMRLLIVEDEIRIREGIQKLLGKMRQDYDIVGEAENGEDGLRMLKELKPDIVITDIRMPKMDGLEMMSYAVKAGITAKAIVLSAYSEFEYARQAMKLGVTEYLLKPISLNDFSQALEHVELQVEKDRQEKPEKIGTLEQILYDFINGRMKMEEDISAYLKHSYQMEEAERLVLIYVYLGNRYEEEKDGAMKQLRHVFSVYPDLSFCILDLIYRKSMVVVLYHYKDAHDLERWLQQQILKQRSRRMTFGWTEVTGAAALKSGLDSLSPYMDWNISFDEEILISYPKITHVQTVPCIYPIELETRIKVAICSDNWDKAKALMREFHDSFHDGKIYAPREIKECYVRFLWAVMGIAKELGCINFESLKQQKLLEMIMEAKRREELAHGADFLFDCIKPREEEKEITHLTVRRVRSMIQEFYQSGITLDEIASKLNVTPEYLGTQFHKEMGLTFSTYMKNFRIGKAKELLCGTHLKLYEIAAKVGYSDPKYFSKVFKEMTGQLPADYRKTLK